MLLAVNGIFGSGAFGVPTNADVSNAYPTNVTPAGLTFAIWGPIFLLQGAGTVLMAAGKAPMLGSTVAVPWLATWACEVGWQLVFAQSPMENGKATGTAGERLAVFVPSCFLLAGGFAGDLSDRQKEHMGAIQTASAQLGKLIDDDDVPERSALRSART